MSAIKENMPLEYYFHRIEKLDKINAEKEEMLMAITSKKYYNALQVGISENRSVQKRIRKVIAQIFNTELLSRSCPNQIPDEYYEHILERDGVIKGISI